MEGCGCGGYGSKWPSSQPSRPTLSGYHLLGVGRVVMVMADPACPSSSFLGSGQVWTVGMERQGRETCRVNWTWRTHPVFEPGRINWCPGMQAGDLSHEDTPARSWERRRDPVWASTGTELLPHLKTLEGQPGDNPSPPMPICPSYAIIYLSVCHLSITYLSIIYHLLIH